MSLKYNPSEPQGGVHNAGIDAESDGVHSFGVMKVKESEDEIGGASGGVHGGGDVRLVPQCNLISHKVLMD